MPKTSTRPPSRIAPDTPAAVQPGCPLDTHLPKARTSPLLYLLVGAVLVLFALWAINPVPCSDLWWQLKTGELIWNERTIPATDRFSFMADGRPWIIQEWATEVFFYLLFTRVSPESMVLFKMLAFAAAMGLALAAAWIRCRRPLVAVAAALFVAYSTHFMVDMRPQMLSYVFLAALLFLLERDRSVSGSRARWLLPPVMLLWVNCHAAFMAGVSVLLAAVAGEVIEAWLRRREERGRETRQQSADERTLVSFRCRRLLLPVSMALLATLANPYGPEIYLYPFTLLRHGSMLNFVQEWFSPDFHASYLKGYQLGLFLVPAALIFSRRSKRPADMLLLSFWAYQSLQSRRHIPVFLILALPVLAEHMVGAMERLGEWWRETSRSEPYAEVGVRPAGSRGFTIRCLALTALVLLGVGHQAASLPKRHLFEYSAGLAFFPRQACDFIDSQGWSGRLYNEFDWGGYCIWRFYPRQLVFIDGRCEVYFGGPWENHHAIHYAQADWAERLRAARVDTLLVNPNSYLNRVLPTSQEWERVYADSMSMVYRRKQPFES